MKNKARLELCLAAALVVLLLWPAASGLAYDDPGALETRILFTARVANPARDRGNFQVFSIRPDGGDLQRITQGELDDCDPDWAGGPVVFERGDWRKSEPG